MYNGYFYTHAYGLPPRFPDYGSIEFIQESANEFLGTQKTLSAEVLGRGNPPKRPTKKPDEEGYAEAQTEYQEKIHLCAKLSENFYEGMYIKQDFDLLLELLHELFSKDYCSFLDTEFAGAAVDFETYDDLLRSVSVAEINSSLHNSANAKHTSVSGQICPSDQLLDPQRECALAGEPLSGGSSISPGVLCLAAL